MTRTKIINRDDGAINTGSLHTNLNEVDFPGETIRSTVRGKSQIRYAFATIAKGRISLAPLSNSVHEKYQAMYPSAQSELRKLNSIHSSVCIGAMAKKFASDGQAAVKDAAHLR